MFTLLKHEPKYFDIGCQEVLVELFPLFFFFGTMIFKKITKRKCLDRE